MLIEISFGEWLQSTRKTLDLTQQQLAERVGCSPETIYKLEANQRRPSKQIAALLAEHMGISQHEQAPFIQFARSQAPITAMNQHHALAPWRQQFLPPHNLPYAVTSFIGREDDLAATSKRLRDDEVRLLTLIGAPGVGKTTLSIRLGEEVILSFPNGVFFVELASMRDPDPTILASRISQTIGILDSGPKPSLTNLKDYLFDRQMLLILDNFEQIIDVAPTVSELLAACPLLKIAVTSRTPLWVRGERQYQLEPLAVPPENAPPEALLDFAACQLFVTQAQHIQSSFHVTPQNAAAISAICRQLDGLPLAIEIISKRIQVLDPLAILDYLQGHSLLQADGFRDADTRHQTLNAAIKWSYDSLEQTVQEMFRGLGVFAGGCTLNAIESVCSPSGSALDTVTALDAVTALANLNMLKKSETGTGEPRFSTLETVRQYAWTQLEQKSLLQDYQIRHADYFLGMALEAEQGIHSNQQVNWLARLELDHQNLTLAYETYRANHDWDKALQLAGALFEFWVFRNHLVEGLTIMRELLSATANDDRYLQGRAKILCGSQMLAHFAGDYVAGYNFGMEAAALAKQIEDAWCIAFASVGLGMATAGQRQFEQADAIFQEGLAAARTIDAGWLIASLLNGLGETARSRQQFETATAHFEEGLQLVQNHRWIAAHILDNMGHVAYALRQFDKAYAYYRESLLASIALEDQRGIAMGIEKIGGLLAADDRARDAAVLLGAAEALRAKKNAPVEEMDQRDYQQFIQLVEKQLTPQALSSAWAEGRALPIEQAVERALNA